MTAQDEYSEANRAMWDERVGIHMTSPFYDVDGFRAGRDTLRPFEATEVGDVQGKSLVHLQCHIALDTLSWARRGAAVTGLDFSEPAIAAASALAREIGLEARFVHADVYDAVEALGQAQFDIVYTGVGAIIWLPDIRRWAEVCAALVKPGGFFYILEGHPLIGVLGADSLTATYDYFRGLDQPYRWDDPGSYADAAAVTVHNLSYEWPHPLGSVVTALIDAGLRIEFLHEHDYTLWQRWPFQEKHGFDEFRLPEGMPKLPLMYSLRASKPA